MHCLMKHKTPFDFPDGQRGAVLIVSLIIMLVMMIAALTSSRSILLQEKMAGATRENHLALEAAEAALADAETDIKTNMTTTGGFNSSGDNGLYASGYAPVKADMIGNAIWSTSGKYIDATTQTVTGVPKGKYVIELVNDDISAVNDSGSVNTLNVSQDYTAQGSKIAGLRITARGESRDGNTVKYIQAYFGKRF